MTMAAQVKIPPGETVAAISVAFPAYISRERGMRDDIRVVTRCAAAITAAASNFPSQMISQAERIAGTFF